MRANAGSIRRRLRAAFVVVAAALALPAAAQADGGVGYRVDGEPGSIIEGGFITLRVGPGGAAAGHFEATNTGSRGAQLSVYSSDGLTGSTTGIVYSDAGTTLRDAGSWLAPSTGGVYLPAKGSRRIDFSVRVPAGARPGDHVGGIVLEQRRSGSTIAQVVRNVVPVLIDVSGPTTTSISLRSAVVSELPGTALPAVTVKMVNDGRRICRPTLTVALTGPSERGTPVTRALDAILPGDSVPYPLPWPRTLTAGTYQASVTASGCGQTRTMRTDVHSDVTAEQDPVPATTGGAANPVVTKAAPDSGTFTAPKRRPANTDASGNGSDRDTGGTAVGGGSSGGGGDPTGASGAGKGSAGSAGPGATAAGALGKLGDVAIEYLPPLLERLIAPLSLLGLMLLFLFAQETFDRKDPKLALAPVQRDPDLEFLPLDDGELGADPARAGDLELVRSPSVPRPATP